jgi:hypothetical protein
VVVVVDIVADIVEQLKKGGPLRNPFERAYLATAPIDYVRIEVQRAIDRIQLRRDPTKWPLAVRRPKVTAADYRKLGDCSARRATLPMPSK